MSTLQGIYKPTNMALGIRFWAAHYARVVPQFEVFECIAYNAYTGQWLFKSRRNGTRITRSFYQLGRPEFRPFLIPTEVLNHAPIPA